MKIIAVDTFASSLAVQNIVELVRTTEIPGWKPIEFESPDELIAALRDLNADAIQKIEIVSEGSPIHLDGVALQAGEGFVRARRFGTALSSVPGVSATTVVYLSGCNTGCHEPFIALADCIAQKIANASGCIVRGSRGYIEGTHATKNETCVPEFEDGDRTFPPVPGSAGTPVKRARCWKEFVPV